MKFSKTQEKLYEKKMRFKKKKLFLKNAKYFFEFIFLKFFLFLFASLEYIYALIFW